MKRVCAALFLCAAPLLCGRELSDVTLYFAPVVGGSAEEREFFDASLPLEIKNPYYRVVENEEEADFLVSVRVDDSEEGADFSHLTLGLMTAAVETPVLELTWRYADKEEMYGWDIGSILAGPVDPAAVAAAAPWEPRSVPEETRRFFLGLRGGAALDGYAFEKAPAYAEGASAGIGAEGGLTAELRLFRFFGVQAEANIVYETFNAPWIVADGESQARSIDNFAFLSFMFPLLAKVPIRFELLTLAPYAGAYALLAPWGAEKKNGASGAGEAEYRMDPLFGVVAGADAGFRAGRGEVVAELRYAVNLGTTKLGGDAGPRYLRDQVVAAVGYRFGVK